MKLLNKPNQFSQSIAQSIFATLNGRRKMNESYPISTVLSVCLMIFCLTFLTSLNFFIYPSDNEVIAQNATPSGPTEEKSSGSGFSLTEEILHETSFEFNSNIVSILSLHHIAEAENLQIIHSELLLRPPRP